MNELPEKWAVEVTKDNYKILGKWRSGNYGSIGDYLHVPSSNFLHTTYNSWAGELQSDYEEITFEQFEMYVLNPKPVVEDYHYLTSILKKLNIQ